MLTPTTRARRGGPSAWRTDGARACGGVAVASFHSRGASTCKRAGGSRARRRCAPFAQLVPLASPPDTRHARKPCARFNSSATAGTAENPFLGDLRNTLQDDADSDVTVVMDNDDVCVHHVCTPTPTTDPQCTGIPSRRDSKEEPPCPLSYHPTYVEHVVRALRPRRHWRRCPQPPGAHGVCMPRLAKNRWGRHVCGGG